jgi:hypothetical protein
LVSNSAKFLRAAPSEEETTAFSPTALSGYSCNWLCALLYEIQDKFRGFDAICECAVYEASKFSPVILR